MLTAAAGSIQNLSTCLYCIGLMHILGDVPAPGSPRRDGCSGPHRSGFRPGFVTKMALVDLLDDLHKRLDSKSTCLLVLFYLSVSVNTIGHGSLLDSLVELACHCSGSAPACLTVPRGCCCESHVSSPFPFLLLVECLRAIASWGQCATFYKAPYHVV